MLFKNENVNLKGVTCYEGSAEQIGLIQHVILMSGKSIPVAGWNSENKGISPYYGEVVGAWEAKASELTPVELLATTLTEDTILLTGAPLTNISKYLEAYPEAVIIKTVTQGGYLGDVIPEERVLEKFKGRKAIRTYNLTQDTDAFTVVNATPQIQDLTYVTKDLCHGFLYTKEIHEQICFNRDDISSLLCKALNYYVQKGVPKAMHDPLAMLYMLEPDIGSRAPISMNFHVDRKHKVFSSSLADSFSTRFGLVDYNKQMAWAHFVSICSGGPNAILNIRNYFIKGLFMSSIDSTDTLDLGILYLKDMGMAVYFPFGNPAYEHDMFSHRIANGNDICFGGGSGEHPCLMLGLADAIFWILGAMSTEDTFDLLYEAANNPEQAKFLESMVPYANGAMPGDSLKEHQEAVYSRVPNFELDMWPLSTWTAARDHFAEVFQVEAKQIDFYDIATVLSCFVLHAFPWEYCRELPILQNYLRVYELLTKQEGYHKSPLVKNHVRVQELISSNALIAAMDLLEAPVTVTIRFGHKEHDAAEFFAKVKTLFKPSPEDNPWGRSLVKNSEGQWQVRWGFNQTMLEAEFEKYRVNPQDETIPFGLTEFFEAKIRNMT